MSTRAIALAFVGGCLGGAARIGISLVWDDAGDVPVTVLAINVIGSLVIGFVAVLWGGHRNVWPLVGPGFLGGFTTFSALAALNWTTTLGPVASVGLLAGWMLVCSLAARVGVVAGERVRQGGAA